MQGAIILREEFNQVLKKMKARIASGANDITSELIQKQVKKFKTNCLNWLRTYMHMAGEILDDFKKNITITLHKKTTTEGCNKFGTWRLMVHSAKILVKIISNKE